MTPRKRNIMTGTCSACAGPCNRRAARCYPCSLDARRARNAQARAERDQRFLARLCECGCGQPAPISQKTMRARGYVAGQPQRYCFGHRGRRAGPNPAGLCQCGCGQRTSPARTNGNGNLRGQPLRWMPGHHTRKSPVEYLVEDRGYETPCWIWQLSCGPKGHGYLFDNGKNRRAHRVFYERAKGPIPAGYHLHHLCEQPPCVNPDHCQPLTPAAHRLTMSTAKLNAETVREIRALAGSMSRKEIAARYGVHWSVIYAILQGRIWQHV